MTNKDALIEKFNDLYGNGGDIRLFFAPGRVNLIGEHTDYNGGHVLPCALTLGTITAVRKRSDNIFRLYSMNFPETGIVEYPSDHFEYSGTHSFADYFKGVAEVLSEKGCVISGGADVMFSGDVPIGSGLSSSASFELSAGIMLRDIYGAMNISLKDLALICQYAENNFLDGKSGILDQFEIGRASCRERV